MSDRIVHTPARGHRCGPNDHGHWADHPYDSPGTVRECKCGRTWVAYRSADPGLMVVLWRSEGRLERWWRERKRQ